MQVIKCETKKNERQVIIQGDKNTILAEYARITEALYRALVRTGISNADTELLLVRCAADGIEENRKEAKNKR